MRLLASASLVAIVLAAPTAASAQFVHVIAPGESLSSVAASDGLSVEALAAANGLAPESPLIAGDTLAIPTREGAPEGTPTEDAEPTASESGQAESPTQTGAPAETEQSAPAETEQGSYVVAPGDTLSAIAARAGTSVEALAALNGIDPSAPLLAGSVLTLPGQAGERSTGEQAAESPPAAAEEGPPYPTEESVAPSEVASIAAEQGVPPSFAEAIAEQESGFNNSLTSSAGARGVMQIVPSTWSWINANLAGPTPLAAASATSNVRGGVLLLHWLLNASEGDPATAAAGYFQGIESVRRQGEIPETEQYVANVLALRERFGGE